MRIALCTLHYAHCTMHIAICTLHYGKHRFWVLNYKQKQKKHLSTPVQNMEWIWIWSAFYLSLMCFLSQINMKWIWFGWNFAVPLNWTKKLNFFVRALVGRLCWSLFVLKHVDKFKTKNLFRDLKILLICKKLIWTRTSNPPPPTNHMPMIKFDKNFGFITDPPPFWTIAKIL